MWQGLFALVPSVLTKRDPKTNRIDATFCQMLQWHVKVFVFVGERVWWALVGGGGCCALLGRNLRADGAYERVRDAVGS